MELGLGIGDPQAPLPTIPARNLSIEFSFSTELAIESQEQELHNQSDSDDPPLPLGLPWSSQPRTTEGVLSQGSRDASAALRGSNDEENGLSSLSRKKLRLSKELSVYLEESFKEHQTLNPIQKLALAKELRLRPRQVEVWFQNRRARTKLKQAEVDRSYLTRCCETLTAENRRIQNELAHLQALNAAQPFFRPPLAHFVPHARESSELALVVTIER